MRPTSLLADQQEEHSDRNQQCSQNTDNERDNPNADAPWASTQRLSAPLRCPTRREGCPSTRHLVLADWLGLSAPFKRRSRSAQDSNRSNHQQPERKHSK